MQRHTIIGAEIIGDHPSKLMKAARDVALCHHERWDGGGYPHELAGNEIPLMARIVTLADVFDALLSERPYKAAWSVPRALAYIEAQQGRQFDPDVVTAFLEVLPECLRIRETYRDR
jgi:putative two-component system response regulator